METFLVGAQILALLCLSAVCLYVIVVLLRVRDVLSSVEKDIREVTSKTVPVLENLEFITARVKNISENVEDQVMMVRDSVSALREIADNVVILERKVQERVEGPILETVAFVAALFKGVRTFVDRVRT